RLASALPSAITLGQLVPGTVIVGTSSPASPASSTQGPGISAARAATVVSARNKPTPRPHPDHSGSRPLRRLLLRGDAALQLLRREADDILVLVRIEVVGIGLQLLEHDAPTQHIPLP